MDAVEDQPGPEDPGMEEPGTNEPGRAELGRAIGSLASRDADRGGLTRVAGLATASMRSAGARSVATGRWFTEAMLDAAPHVPVRDLATLSAHHGGLTGAELADALVRSASRTTAGLGALAGALAGAEELAPPTWLAIPAELVVETLAVVAVEMKLVAELQAAFGRPVVGTPTERGLAVAKAWAEGRGVTAALVAGPGGVAEALGRTTRREVTRLIQRRLARRAMRSLSALAPFMAGAVAGAELNRRATRRLGDSIVRDLAGR
jgi:hypothetical protein